MKDYTPRASKLVPSSTSNLCTILDGNYSTSRKTTRDPNLRVVAAVIPVKDRTATHGYAERDITHQLSLSIRNGVVYTNDAVKRIAHAAVHTYQSDMQGRCRAKHQAVGVLAIGGCNERGWGRE
ncbi:hypothetical protein DER46DRAFT_574281 [Fusarium sp. MPI-SDFR-AT-0072]|nr:hypothetical protein DER46DRAFT_574281 [Fusarium sp. MPI-SDFR-AT-0072]